MVPWCVSILFILVKGDLLASLLSRRIDIDLVIIIAVFFLSIQREKEAGIFAFSQGTLIDILSGTPMGFSGFLYFTVFIVIKLLSYPIDIYSESGRIMVIFIAVILKNLIVLFLLEIVSLRYEFYHNEFLLYIFSAILSVFAASFLLRFLYNLNGRFSREASEL